MIRARLRRLVDPRIMRKSRAAATAGAVSAVAILVGMVVPFDVVRAILIALAVFVGVAAPCWFVLAAAETVGLETRSLWGLHGVVTDGRLWPPPGAWALGADAIALVLTESRSRGLRTVVELGPGASSVVLGRGSEGELELFGVEHDARYASLLRWYLAQHDLTDAYTLIEAPLTAQTIDGTKATWYDQAGIDRLPAEIDVLIVDGPPARPGVLTRGAAWTLIEQRMQTGGLVLVDDAIRPEERALVRKWVRHGGLRIVRDSGTFVLLEVP